VSLTGGNSKPKIGVLSWLPQSAKDDLDRFRQGMREAGYTEPEDYVLEAYFTGGNPQLARDMARKLPRSRWTLSLRRDAGDSYRQSIWPRPSRTPRSERVAPE
jgi:hypothetical protein